MKPLSLSLVIGASLTLGGCLSTENVRPIGDQGRLEAVAQTRGPERDRQAILSMVGEYKVTFAFAEHAPSRGYQPKPPSRSEAYEVVLVAEDTGRRIVLQHLLVHRTLGFVLKHWRQDWHYEAPRRLEFVADQTWRVRSIPAATTRGGWTQCVYEVSDAPRYCGTGRWTYAGGTAVWKSDLGWRPLPRREYTKRSDYNALRVVNIHRITDQGWEHEQHNAKIRREGGRTASVLVREKGMNTYQRIKGYDFGGGYHYWKATESYWRRIRAEWARNIEQNQGIHLRYPVEGMTMIWAMYWQSEAARFGLPVSDASIRELFRPWVGAPGEGAGPTR
ncbi:DUF6607 family protein [Enterovirga rhinocerotis]|uniref:Uncharacterized protein n=1 Tax=Enterovirga rhinocerotis TaxID=1339210 RepID=A0A4R7BHD7_9HYPH|nr:DUF6607 family protein [Enterovirga rhinocerotis]TDR84521.1 hypothetical protein EV668_4880 [Enterovirga rhinocerotis]